MTNTRTRVEPLHCPEGAGSTLHPLRIVDHRIGDEARAFIFLAAVAPLVLPACTVVARAAA